MYVQHIYTYTVHVHTVLVSVICSGVGVAISEVGVVCCDEVTVTSVTCDMESGDSGLISPYAITRARSCSYPSRILSVIYYIYMYM